MSHRGRGRVALALVTALALLALAGCTAPTTDDGRADPLVDRQGWEDGYWYDDPVAVTTEDGLNESEREAVVARAMARVERVRGEEFRRSVSVEVVSRETYRERYGRDAGTDPWTEQVWKAPFLVGENESVERALGSTLGATVQGFYAPREGRIVLVAEGDSPTVDRRTLVHELVHALQHQHQQLSLGERTATLDARLAQQGVVEGDANYVTDRYERRCDGEWDCIERPPRPATGGGSAFDQGVFLVVFTPYAAGPGFVGHARDEDGWAAVNRLYRSFPASTEQVIHPEKYPDEEPRQVEVPDRSAGAWSRFDRDPATNTLGEAGIYAMFWATDRIDRQGSALYSYEHTLSEGWAGDTLVPYRNGDRHGYVWAVAWDSRADAREFETAYREVLAERADRRPDADTYVLPGSDPFVGAYRVERDGRRVRIVHAPTVGALSGVHGDG